MTVLSPAVRDVWSDVRRMSVTAIGWVLYAIGWVLAKSLRSVVTCVAAVLYAAGYVGARVVWPALRWCGDAVVLGWREGRKPARRS